MCAHKTPTKQSEWKVGRAVNSGQQSGVPAPLGMIAVVNAMLKNKNNVWVSIELKDISCTITDREKSKKWFMK